MAFRSLAEIVAHELVPQPFAQLRSAPLLVEQFEFYRDRIWDILVLQPDIHALAVCQFGLLRNGEAIAPIVVEPTRHEMRISFSLSTLCQVR